MQGEGEKAGEAIENWELGIGNDLSMARGQKYRAGYTQAQEIFFLCLKPCTRSHLSNSVLVCEPNLERRIIRN